MKMLFKGHSTRLEMLIEKIHSHKENSYQDSEVSGSSEARPTSADDNLPELNSESPKSLSDTEEEKCDNDDNSQFNDDKFSCGFCPRQFKHKRSRDRHIKLHTGDKKYKCIQCESAFARSDHLKIHKKTHDFKKQYKCPKCNKGYNTATAFTFHEKSHKDDNDDESTSVWAKTDIKTICVHCFQWFSNIELMKEHIKSVHRHGTENHLKKLKKDEPKFQYEDPTKSQEAFICSCCYEALPNFKSFLLHMETHVSSIKTKLQHQETDPPYIVPLINYLCCCHCNMYFDSSDKLQEHLVDSHVATLYKCTLCEKNFEDIVSMKSHLSSKHMSFEHFECSCPEEPKLFHDRMSAELHFAKHHSAMKMGAEQKPPMDVYRDNKTSTGILGHRCIYCKEYYKTKSDLQLHLRSHQLSEKSRHKCNICDETFAGSSELASHRLVHCKIVEGNICMACKAILLDEDSFVKHQLKHNDTSKSASKLNLILPYICIVCSQTLQSDSEIELHAKFHLKFLTEQTSLMQQDQTGYSDELNFVVENPFQYGDVNLELQCHLCKKAFSTKNKLQVHLIEHTFFGINQYNCYICSSVFTGATGLQNHLLTHNMAEKPYQCSRCSAGFFFRAELDNHKYVHNFKVQYDSFREETKSFSSD